MCPLREFLVYKPVADSSDVVIRRRGFSIVGTHEPAIAMPPPSSCLHTVLFYPQRNQIYLVGRHQGVRRFVSPGLHHIKSVSSHCRTLIGKTYVDLVWFVPSESGDGYSPSASLPNGD